MCFVNKTTVSIPLCVSPLTEQTRAWILAGAKNNEDQIRSLLNNNAKIYSTRDPTTGYTCLHWAAKYGNESLIHLLIGRYRMNPNIRTREDLKMNQAYSFI